MIATSRSAPNRGHSPADSPSSPDGPDGTGAELNAVQAARRVARLFPEVYRRYHWANRVGGGELPVTRRALEVLQHLCASGPLTVGEQAEHLGLRRNSVSELLQRLEAKGLVARIRDERDERRVLVWLTDSGRDVVSRVGQVLAPDRIAQVMASLSPEERATVVRGFELLASADPSNSAATAATRTQAATAAAAEPGAATPPERSLR
jgi:DNA-binding MarR family transcriptional regulator